MVRTGRAAPLPPAERRAAILRAVRPVVLERGLAVTTKELARAAGVAEGTLFRVFDDKSALVRAAAAEAVDPAGDLAAIAAIDRSLPLEQRLALVVALGLARAAEGMRWMMILHEVARLDPPQPGTDHRAHMRDVHARSELGRAQVRAALLELLEPDQDRLTWSPDETAELLDVMLMGVTVRTIDARRRGVEPSTPSADVLVTAFLDGVLVRR
ncbi:TetR/AcrR family transcriptional regulator [Cellulomonas composti]|uniref:HTH tetR-type domain-containing protein n=1 Tax=Cellulomonas composti TaxID=266130 RepID=A0A511J5V5_9CELL|nr:TetR/AcrR family transcriptional regulator [Cellulomonas composti]GEL93392.1 hypothetical protein CCO02nite_00500 [Cellulomonas composti]